MNGARMGVKCAGCGRVSKIPAICEATVWLSQMISSQRITHGIYAAH